MNQSQYDLELAKYDSAIEYCKKQYGNCAGVISIQNDNWSDDTILVFVDSSFNHFNFPDFIFDIPVRIIDPYKEKEEYSSLLDNLTIEHPQLWDDNSPLNWIKEIILSHNKIIWKHESKNAVSFLR